jgi:hypothetical protein
VRKTWNTTISKASEIMDMGAEESARVPCEVEDVVDISNIMSMLHENKARVGTAPLWVCDLVAVI